MQDGESLKQDGASFGENDFQHTPSADRRRLLQNFIDSTLKADGTPIDDPLLIKQLSRLSGELGRRPITRRALLQLFAINASVLAINTVIPQASDSSCAFKLPLAGCDNEELSTKPDFSASVLRKEDMLALRFDFYHMKLNGTNLQRMYADRNAYIVVNFAHGNDYLPQNIAEQAYLETAAELGSDTEDPNNNPNPPGGSETPGQPGSVGARLAGASRLVFKIPPGTSPIPFTLDELLSWEKYELSLAPTALPADEQAPGQEPVEPLYWQTALEVPWQLIVSPNYHAGWAHALQPVTRSQRTELWHTRMGIRTPDSLNPGQWSVDERQTIYRTLRAIWAQGFDRTVTPDANDLSPFRTSLTQNDRWQMVRLCSDYNISPPGIVPVYYNPSPIQVNRFMLSSLGAWMDTRGEWPNAPASADLDIIEWRHLAAMARDNYVRVVYRGYLFPTGHSATLVKVTERKFQPVPAGGPLTGQTAAYLRQRFFIVVRQPVKTYPAHSSQPFQGREWPFTSVRITTLITPSLDDPGLHGDAYDLEGQGQKAFWPRVAGQDFLFHLIAEDSDSQKTEFTCPLAFISSTLQQPDDVASFIEPAISSYKTGSANASRRQRSLSGQKVAFAPSSKKDGLPGGKPGDTSAEVKSIILGAVLPQPSGASLPENQARFFPTWQEAEVRLPAAEQASGSPLPGPVVIQMHPDFREKGFNASSNPGYIWAKLKDMVDLSFNGAGDKSGAVVTPNIKIGGLSRTIGVVGGTVNATPTQFNPADFFSDAKILGGILLADIVQAASFGDGRKTPQLTNYVIYPNGNNSLPPEALETRLDWKPEVTGDPLRIFEPTSSTSMEVKEKFITPLDPPGEPTYTITGDLRSFWVNILGESFLFLRLHFNKVTFTAETGKKANVDVDIDSCEFAGVLEFVNTLKDYLETLGTGLSIDITPTQVSAGYSLPIPTVAVGVMSIQNISLGVKLVIPFTGNPARVRFNFCEREQPFLLTVFAIGGGGFFAIEVGLDGVERLEAALEFGASLALDIGVASGEVHIMGGVYYEMEKVGQPDETIALTSYIRMGGSLEVLGIISLSVEFYLGMTFQKPPNELWGQAKLTVKVEVLFFSASVELSVERRLAGGEGGSQSMFAVPDHGHLVKLGAAATSTGIGGFDELISQDDWTEYAGAFAPVPAAG